MRSMCTFLLGAALVAIAAPHSPAVVTTWSSPALDSWTYPAVSSPGSRTLGPTFLTSPGTDENGQFLPSSSRDPMRRGMSFVAFDTSTEITTGYTPTRYTINSVTVTFTMQQSTGGSILYDDTTDTNAELLADYWSGDIDTARPVELFGVGFQAGNIGFDLGSGDPDNNLFSENEYPYYPGGASGVLVAYPLVMDANGNQVDVSNSMSGGYSATAPDNTTAPFDPVPWAIGKVPGLNNGDPVPANTTFTFDVDLEQFGVREYVQESLSTGALGFYLSSLHFAGDPHNGFTLPYPQWYLKEFPAQYGGIAPTLAIDYELASLPGDFDNDGDVDTTDLATWQAGYGSQYSGADFLVWQRNFTGPLSAAAQAVPEPTAGMLAACISLLCVMRRRKDSSK